MNSLFTVWTIIGVVIFVAVLAFIFLFVFMLYVKPAPGIAEGVYEVIGKKQSGSHQKSNHVKIKGLMVDSTNYFCSPDLTKLFRAILLRDIGHLKDSADKKTKATEATIPKGVESAEKKNQKIAPPENTALLSNLETQLNNLPLDKICRIIVMRNGFFGKKDLLVVFGDIKRSLSSYASFDEENSFSLFFGPMNKGTIFGKIQTLPIDYDFSNRSFKIGKMTVHLFTPDEPAAVNEEEKKIASNRDLLAKILLHIPTAVHSDVMIQSLNNRLKAKDTEAQNLREELDQTASALSNAQIALNAVVPGEKPISTIPKKMDIYDGICIMAFTTIGSYLFDVFKIHFLVGTIAGLSLAMFVIYRRR